MKAALLNSLFILAMMFTATASYAGPVTEGQIVNFKFKKYIAYDVEGSTDDAACEIRVDKDVKIPPKVIESMVYYFKIKDAKLMKLITPVYVANEVDSCDSYAKYIYFTFMKDTTTGHIYMLDWKFTARSDSGYFRQVLEVTSNKIVMENPLHENWETELVTSDKKPDFVDRHAYGEQ